jgi:hypothetical protein
MPLTFEGIFYVEHINSVNRYRRILRCSFVDAQGVCRTIDIGHFQSTYPPLYPSFVEPVKVGTVYFIQGMVIL